VTRTVRVTACGRRRSIKALEDKRQMIGGNANAVIPAVPPDPARST
jgi:hypothetical protein